MIFIDPWKDFDYQKVFDVPENLFLVKNTRICLPQSIDPKDEKPFCMYSNDKIVSVHLVPQEKFKDKKVTLMIQFWHSIYIASPSGSSTRRMTNHNKVEPQYAVQGLKDSLFFAEKCLDSSDIFMIKLSNMGSRAIKRKVYELQARVVAMENDNSSNATLQDKKNIKNTLFVLCDDQVVRHL